MYRVEHWVVCVCIGSHVCVCMCTQACICQSQATHGQYSTYGGTHVPTHTHTCMHTEYVHALACRCRHVHINMVALKTCTSALQHVATGA